MTPEQQKVYDQATVAAQTAAATIGKTYTPGVGVSSGVTVPPVITTSTLNQNQTPLPFVNPNQQPMYTGVPTLSQNTTPDIQMTPFQQSIQNSLKDLTTPGSAYDTSGKSTFQNTQNQTQDIAGKTKLVNDLTASFNDLSRQSIEIANNVQNTTSGLPITDRVQVGISNKLKSENALQINRLASQIETAKGNLTYAQTLADNAVKAKYDPIEANRQALIDNLNILMKSPQATIDEKNQAQKQLDYQNAQKTQEATDKQNMADVLKITNDAIANGLTDSKIISQLNTAKTPQDANAIIAPTGFGMSPTAALDAQYKQAQIQKMQQDIATANATETTVSPDTLQGMLNVYKATGVLPSFGLGAKNPLRAQFYAALGADGGLVTDANTNKAVRAGLTTAYKTQQNQLAANQTAIGTLDQQLKLAQSYSDKVNRSDSPLIAKYVLGIKSGVFGDADAAALNNIVKTASYEFAKILSGSAASVAGVTVSSAADAESMLNSAMSKGQFKEVLSLMDTEAGYRLQSQSDTLKQLENDLNNVGSLSTDLKNSNTNSTTKSGKPFDYQAAKNAGYSEAEIQSYLNAN